MPAFRNVSLRQIMSYCFSATNCLNSWRWVCRPLQFHCKIVTPIINGIFVHFAIYFVIVAYHLHTSIHWHNYATGVLPLPHWSVSDGFASIVLPPCRALSMGLLADKTLLTRLAYGTLAVCSVDGSLLFRPRFNPFSVDVIVSAPAVLTELGSKRLIVFSSVVTTEARLVKCSCCSFDGCVIVLIIQWSELATYLNISSVVLLFSLSPFEHGHLLSRFGPRLTVSQSRSPHCCASCWVSLYVWHGQYCLACSPQQSVSFILASRDHLLKIF